MYSPSNIAGPFGIDWSLFSDFAFDPGLLADFGFLKNVEIFSNIHPPVHERTNLTRSEVALNRVNFAHITSLGLVQIPEMAQRVISSRHLCRFPV